MSLDQDPGDPAVYQLVARLRLGQVLRDLGGMDNLTVLVDDGRQVLRSYKPFVPRQRIVELQQLREAVQAAGLITVVPIEIAGRSVHRCGHRWAEVEPFIMLPRPVRRDPAALFAGLGRLHRVLALQPSLSTSDLRPSFVTVDVLRAWLDLNTADELLTCERASELRNLLDRVEQRWVRPDSLPVQLVHTDPHPANILPGDRPAQDCVYLDFGGAEMAPRAHDLAVAVVYQLAMHHAGRIAPAIAELPDWLAAYDQANPAMLTRLERGAIPVYAAAVAAYYDICGWGPGWRSLGARLLDHTQDR